MIKVNIKKNGNMRIKTRNKTIKNNKSKKKVIIPVGWTLSQSINKNN